MKILFYTFVLVLLPYNITFGQKPFETDKIVGWPTPVVNPDRMADSTSLDSTFTGFAVPWWYDCQTLEPLWFCTISGPTPPVNDSNQWVDVGEGLWIGGLLLADSADTAHGQVAIGYVHRPLTGDCNCNGEYDISDITLLVNHLFLGGSPPNCNP